RVHGRRRRRAHHQPRRGPRDARARARAPGRDGAELPRAGPRVRLGVRDDPRRDGRRRVRPRARHRLLHRRGDVRPAGRGAGPRDGPDRDDAAGRLHARDAGPRGGGDRGRGLGHGDGGPVPRGRQDRARRGRARAPRRGRARARAVPGATARRGERVRRTAGRRCGPRLGGGGAVTAPTPVVARAPGAWAHVDDVLGPSRTRFFGSGYRRTTPRLRDLRVTHRGDRSTLEALGSLDVEGTWSRKDGREQRQHLATTDALALAAQSVTALLATRFAPETAAAAAVTEVEVRASDTPLEDALDAFTVTAGIDAGDGAASHVFDAAVGPLAVRGRVRRPLAVESLADLSSVGALAAL